MQDLIQVTMADDTVIDEFPTLDAAAEWLVDHKEDFRAAVVITGRRAMVRTHELDRLIRYVRAEREEAAQEDALDAEHIRIESHPSIFI